MFVKKVTNQGNKTFSAEKPKGSKSNFSKKERFKDFDLAIKHQTIIGPGSYNIIDSSKKVYKRPCIPKYLNYQGINRINSIGYFYVNDAIVYDPVLLRKKS